MESNIEYWKNLSLENIRYIDPCGVEKEEQWLPVKGYEGLYMVSDCGRVKSISREIVTKRYVYTSRTFILKQYPTDKRGYVRVPFTVKSITKQYYVHILVSRAFIQNPEKKRCVNHKKGIKTDNRASELEWCTYGENHAHSYRELGRIHSMTGRTGYRNKKSKQILCITTGEIYSSLSEASKTLNIPFQNVSKVCLGKRPKAHGLSFKYI